VSQVKSIALCALALFCFNKNKVLSCKSKKTSTLHVHIHTGFGEAPPEAKAANNLHNFFTYIAVKIVAAQLEVSPPSLLVRLVPLD